MRFTIKDITMAHRYLEYNGEQPQTPEDAWGITLEKWANLAEQPMFIYDGQGATCGLCMYYTGPGGDCGDCPINLLGFEQCEGTPYMEYSEDRPEGAIEEFWFLLALYAAQD